MQARSTLVLLEFEWSNNLLTRIVNQAQSAKCKDNDWRGQCCSHLWAHQEEEHCIPPSKFLQGGPSPFLHHLKIQPVSPTCRVAAVHVYMKCMCVCEGSEHCTYIQLSYAMLFRFGSIIIHKHLGDSSLSIDRCNVLEPSLLSRMYLNKPSQSIQALPPD